MLCAVEGNSFGCLCRDSFARSPRARGICTSTPCWFQCNAPALLKHPRTSSAKPPHLPHIPLLLCCHTTHSSGVQVENPRGSEPLQPLFRSAPKPAQPDEPSSAPRAEQGSQASEEASAKPAAEPAPAEEAAGAPAAAPAAEQADATAAEIENAVVVPPPPKTPEEEEQEFAADIAMTVALAVRVSPPSRAGHALAA